VCQRIQQATVIESVSGIWSDEKGVPHIVRIEQRFEV
jgi:hypothetical protein